MNTAKYEAGSYTGGAIPYPLLVKTSGIVQQLCPLSYNTPHAAPWNTPSVGIAFVGDFRYHSPTDRQWEMAKFLGAVFLHHGLELFGHTELPIKSTSKVCPGSYFDMDALRREAGAFLVLHKDSIGPLSFYFTV
jgi:hypothetical protein